MSDAGSSRAAASIAACEMAEVSASRSSRNTMPGIGSRPAFLRKLCEVRMREMAQRSIAASIDSRPAVKFRLTDYLAGEDDGDVGERAADRGRQQEADVFVVRGEAADGAGEQEAADQGAAEGQLAAGRIGHRERRPAALGCAYEARSECAAVGGR